MKHPRCPKTTIDTPLPPLRPWLRLRRFGEKTPSVPYPSALTMHYLSSSDVVVAIMGVTGSGKSTFVSQLVGQENVVVGHSLQSGRPCRVPRSYCRIFLILNRCRNQGYLHIRVPPTRPGIHPRRRHAWFR